MIKIDHRTPELGGGCLINLIKANVFLNIGFVMENLIAKIVVMREKRAELNATIINGNVTTDNAFLRTG